MRNTVISFQVSDRCSGMTVKTFLRQEHNMSAGMLTSLKFQENGICCNGAKINSNQRIKAKDVITLTLPCDVNILQPVKMDLCVAYEDEHILVINKPPNITVHPTKCYVNDTLANGVAYYMQQKNELCAFRPINRLDKDTSGLVLIAKNRYIAGCLQQSKTEKIYYAVCEGCIEKSGTINSNIDLMPGHTIQRCVTHNTKGQKAITHYEPAKIGNNHTLLKIWLETGRTHQIRVHMASVGHPLAGDDMYGGSLKYITRQALHCGQMKFLHPIDGKIIDLYAHIPQDILNVLK